MVIRHKHYSINQLINQSSILQHGARENRSFRSTGRGVLTRPKTGRVNVAEFVNSMKHRRVFMVQTYVRFVFIHES